MISSEILSGFNVDGDYNKAIFIENKSKQMDSNQPLKRMKTIYTDIHMIKRLAEEFFFKSHSFSDLVLVVQDKELYVDRSVLAAGSKVFQSYFQDANMDSIEILDVTPDEMIELLQFLYPQFRRTINNDNVTILLILAHRFELNFISSACRTFILLYLSKFEYINMYPNGGEFIQQDDGIRLSISSILDILCIWFREFLLVGDRTACDAILNRLARCNSSSILASNGFMDLEDRMKWKIFQARTKYLENQRISEFEQK
ncbi:unnamed protein product [Rotaria socialis]|uniref:BTB domain-containing protein n=1 Tax=Rotaria socialis TaxID=392032 RepID=A0A818KIW2_9BILA|nr:unnamed protein product [Rotaria socialis]CAF4595065.1 unnamed protein product [Rotaria socialis]